MGREEGGTPPKGRVEMRTKRIWLIISILLIPTLWFGEEKKSEAISGKGTIKTIKIVVSQSNEPADAEVPYKEVISRLFELAGAKVVPDDSPNFDALLTIEVQGKAIGRNYKLGGLLWTGAKIKGSITLEMKNKRIEDKFDIDYPAWDISPLEFPEPYSKIYADMYKSPSSALASYAFGAHYGLGHKLATLCYKLFGLKPLLLAFQDSDFYLPTAAGLGLIEAKDKSAIAPLSELVMNKDKPKDLRWRAIWVLGEMGYPDASSVLSQALEDEDVNIRYSAMEALGKIKSKDAVEPLIAILKKQEDPSIKSLVIEALGNIGDERAVDLLADYLNAQDESLIRKSIEALSKIKCERSAELLLPLLNHKNIDIAFDARVGLANLGASAIPVLISALKTNPNISRATIGEIFTYRLKDPLAIPQLLSALKDSESIVREYAVAGLVSIGRPSIEPLIDFLRTEQDQRARNMAASALRGITKQNLGANAEEWQRWWEANRDKFPQKD